MKYSITWKEGRQEKENQKDKINRKQKQQTIIYLVMAIITLHVNGLNTPINRQKLSDWSKGKTQLCAAYKKCALNIETKTD